MNRTLFPRLLAGALTAAALGTATVAEARPDVYFSVGIQSGPVWVQPAPVYLPPRPVYVLPAPVYVSPPAYERPRWIGNDARREWERERAWRRAEWLRLQRYEDERRGDHDHDGRRRIHRD